ncbi:MAG: hypothetical protein R6X34_14265 [Chloroflexota bacterium]
MSHYSQGFEGANGGSVEIFCQTFTTGVAALLLAWPTAVATTSHLRPA